MLEFAEFLTTRPLRSPRTGWMNSVAWVGKTLT